MTSQLQRSIYKLKLKVSNNIDWEDEKIKLWKETAEEKQAFYCTTLGTRTWEEYKKDEELFLQLKIGFSLYGPPAEDSCGNEETNETLLEKFFEDPNKKKTIEKITQLVQSEWKSEKMCIAFIYVIAWINEEYAEFPVIRVLQGQTEDGNEIVCFIDSLGRVYKTWLGFIKNNMYPKCIYCYPKDGYYSWIHGKVSIE